MEEIYALLGVHPTTPADGIEEAYQNKKREYAPDGFVQGSQEWSDAVAMQDKLRQAYDAAMMATFAPIRAFSPSPDAPRPPVAQALMEEPQIFPPSSVSNGAHRYPPYEHSQPESPAFTGYASPAQEVIRSEYRPSSSSSVSADVRNLVEEVPVHFSDAELLSMNIDELRDSLHPEGENKKGILPTLGIEDPLLRTYVWGYIAFALADLFMRFAFADIWDNLSLLLRRYGLDEGIAKLSPLASVVASFVSIFYIFACSLVMPILVRFFVVRQPVEKTRTRMLLSALAVVMAFAFYTATGFLFRFLPAAWAGSSGNVFWIAPWICQRTLKYAGRDI